MTSPASQVTFADDTAGQLHLSALRLFRVMRAARPAHGLSSAKLSVLGRLYQDGTATATDLAAYLRIQPQSISRMLADLAHQGLITRRLNSADRRQSLIEITLAGVRELTEEIRHQRVHLAQAMSVSLSAVEQEILRLAALLIDRLAAAAEDRMPDGLEE